MQVICVGEMLVDFTPGGEQRNYIANAGGAPANVAVSIRRSGGSAGFLGKLGDDDFGRMLADTLRRDGVEILCPEPTREAVTTLAFVSLDERGERSFTFARKPGADMLLSERDVEGVDFSSCRIVHAGSMSQSARPARDAVLLALRKAKKLGKLVSFDINYRETVWSREACAAELKEIFPLVDLLKISGEELDFVGGAEGISTFMEQNRIAVTVVTMGADGAEIYFDSQRIRLDAMRVRAKDATGAGDSFWGAFLCRLLEQGVERVENITTEKLIAAGRFAICASGLCVQKSGGIPAIPYREQVDAVLAAMQAE